MKHCKECNTEFNSGDESQELCFLCYCKQNDDGLSEEEREEAYLKAAIELCSACRFGADLCVCGDNQSFLEKEEDYDENERDEDYDYCPECDMPATTDHKECRYCGAYLRNNW